MEKHYKVILVVEFGSTYTWGLLRGIAKYSRLHGPWVYYRIPAYQLASCWKERKKYLARLKEWNADGVIARDLNDIKDLIDTGLPAVCTDDNEPTEGRPNVISDYNATGKMAAEYLINRGFRRFAFCGFEDFYWSIKRQEGFVKWINQAGYEMNV